MFEIILQIIGFIGIALSLISVQFNTHGKIMLFKTSSSFMFCLQYLLMGAYTGMVMDMIGTVRNIVFAYNVKKGRSNKWFIVLFALLTVIIGVTTLVLTWSSLVERVMWLAGTPERALVVAVIVSIISVIAKLLSTVAYGFKNAHAIRMTNLPTCSGWIIYNFAVLSIAGVINEALSIISIIIAEIRFKPQRYRKSKNDATK